MVAIVVSLLASAVLAPQGVHTKGNGILKQENRKIGSFSRIQVGGAVDVEVKIGPTSSLKIEAESNILPLYKTLVRGETLVVSSEGSITTNKTIHVWITTPFLKGVAVGGASEMNVTNLKGSQFDAELSGASRLTATGAVDSLRLAATGASQFHLLKLTAKSAKVDASGASQLNLNVSGKLSGDASGASGISYRGKPTTSVSTSGASHVRAIR